MKYYISDWHYNHDNIIPFDNRPFMTTEDMNAELILRWNSVVKKSDIVYSLGDMFFCNDQDASSVLKRLNGQKILIRGNHDRCDKKIFKDNFAKITEYLEIEDEGNKIVLCHYPIPCFKNHYYGWNHFYGHVHSSFEWNITENTKKLMEELYSVKCNMYNVGAMMPWINYTPRTFNEIISNYIGGV